MKNQGNGSDESASGNFFRDRKKVCIGVLSKSMLV